MLKKWLIQLVYHLFVQFHRGHH
ncbi:hypothetical protein CY0110_19832 [Crocosphaera chwakensis CCY0110]|uniref:Uncharacterized protein n=1 Tax=Crocosphaera chwakensis CCY0110 TaxID=391612 RepID=A3IJU8_9CHRO|nr:hypothetical protein CY0110_19832 [Crocosphaera chwakensis CCY0110]